MLALIGHKIFNQDIPPLSFFNSKTTRKFKPSTEQRIGRERSVSNDYNY